MKAHSLLMNLSHKNKNLKRWKRKISGPSGQFLKPTKISETKEPGQGGGWWSLVLYLVMWWAMYLFKVAIFEVGASLKWMPGKSKLKSGTCTKIRDNPAVRASTTGLCKSLKWLLWGWICPLVHFLFAKRRTYLWNLLSRRMKDTWKNAWI